jgi:hypothetical protein
LYGKIKFKKTGPTSVLIAKEDQVVVSWVLALQDFRLSISWPQLKMKVVELTQTKSTFFQTKSTKDLVMVLI